MDVFDAQVHLWDRASPRRPLSQTVLAKAPGSLSEPLRVFFDEYSLTGEAFVSQMDSAGVRGALIVTPTIYADSSYSLKVCRAWPDRYRIVGSVDHRRPDIEDLMEAWLRQEFMVGARIMILDAAARDALDDGEYDRFFRGAKRGNVPICLLMPNDPARVARLAGRFHDVQFVLDHMGLMPNPLAPTADHLAAIDDIVAALCKFPNIAMKIGNLPALSGHGPPFAEVWDPIRRVLDAFGAERTMWASDHSWYPNLPYRTHVDAIRRDIDLSESEREWVTGAALRRIFGW